MVITPYDSETATLIHFSNEHSRESSMTRYIILDSHQNGDQVASRVFFRNLKRNRARILILIRWFGLSGRAQTARVGAYVS